MTSIIQTENLVGKLAFGIWASTFGVKIKIYNVDNGRLSEQPLRSEIEDVHQTINVFGVGSHHQNDIVERNIQTITLRDITLLIYQRQ